MLYFIYIIDTYIWRYIDIYIIAILYSNSYIIVIYIMLLYFIYILYTQYFFQSIKNVVNDICSSTCVSNIWLTFNEDTTDVSDPCCLKLLQLSSKKAENKLEVKNCIFINQVFKKNLVLNMWITALEQEAGWSFHTL